MSFNAHAFGDFVATLKTVRLTGMWRALEEKGLPIEVIRRNSLIAPAACNLASPDRTATVDDAFRVRREVSRSMRGRGGGAG